MSDLSLRSRAIIDSARDADGPSAADKARVRGALFAQIGVAGAAGAAEAATPAAGGSGGPSSTLNVIAESNGVSGLTTGAATSAGGLAGATAKTLIGIAIVGSVGLGGYFMVASDQSETKPSIQAAAVVESTLALPETSATPASPEAPEAAPSPAPAVSPAPEVSAELEVSPVPEAPAPAPEVSRPVVPKKPARAATGARQPRAVKAPPASPPKAKPEPSVQNGSEQGDSGDDSSSALASLRQEHRLIRGAKRALTKGNPALALQILTDHAEAFPSGQLVQERSALRLVALCKLGRHPSAERERANFQARWPKSPHNATIRGACGKE